MKIVELFVENVKGVIEVTVRPISNLVEVCGDNGAGKSTLLDAIWWIIKGTRNIQEKPIRDGESEAVITLDIGRYRIKRVFRDRGDGRKFTTRVEVRTAEGKIVKAAQTKVLDKLLGALSIDPLEFVKSKPLEQARRILQIAGISLDDHDKREAADYEQRKIHNRKVKTLRTLAEGLRQELPPKAKVVISALTKKLSEAYQSNQARTEELSRRGTAAHRVKEIDTEVAKSMSSIERLRKKIADLRSEQTQLETNLEEAPDLGEAIDTETIQKKINQAGEINRLFEREQTRQRHLKEARTHARASWNLSSEIEGRKTELQARIAKSALPVDGLSVIDSSVCYQGIPLSQCSDAEQLRVACAVAMADDPELRVIRVREGSLLDKTSMGIIEEMAKEEDWQMWVERVGEEPTGDCAVVLREGVRHA